MDNLFSWLSWNRTFVGIIGQFLFTSIHFLMMEWFGHNITFCTCIHSWSSLSCLSLFTPCNMAWELLECNKHPLTTSWGICHNLSHRTIVCKPCLSTWEKHGTSITLSLQNSHSFPSWLGVGFNTLLSPKSWWNVCLFLRLTSAPVSALSNIVDWGESMLFPFKVVGSRATGNLIKMFVHMGDTDHVSVDWLSLIIEI